MIKNITSLKIENEKRTYQLIMSTDSPLGEVYDVLSEMKAYVFELIKNNEKNEGQDDRKMDSKSSC